ncbi:hypothetical protein OJAV_G00076920 [Oryzias javanicus]|uniref:Secreted protein n=1 Tax=Oryzias javanicus TaxID=123683 RepID=A0A437D3L7_ORYJA|nr:hypothetical protein OJAV_G00076920 [Oryzias javanicus]
MSLMFRQLLLPPFLSLFTVTLLESRSWENKPTLPTYLVVCYNYSEVRGVGTALLLGSAECDAGELKQKKRLGLCMPLTWTRL